MMKHWAKKKSMLGRNQEIHSLGEGWLRLEEEKF
jgi:hypothetical protein